jgi:hypothetical protein
MWNKSGLIAVALVLLTAVSTAQAGLASLLEDAVKVAAKDTAKVAAKDAANAGAKGAENVAKSEAEARAPGVVVENKIGGLEATGAAVEANGVKVENSAGAGGGGGGGDDPPVWFDVLCFLALGGWVLSKLRGKAGPARTRPRS